jgi:serine protease
VLVGVSAGASDRAAAVEAHLPASAEVVHENERLGYVAVAFPADAAGDRRAFQASITDAPRVKYAEPNATHRTLYTPNDPLYSEQYAPQKVDADDAWDELLGDCGTKIAIVDQGVQYDHPDLDYCSSPAAERDFVENDGRAYPTDLSSEYHGTAVAGLAAAETDNGKGIAGITNASLVVARALDENGAGSTSDIADAIQWAADQGAHVINLSLGGGGYNSTMKNAVSYAYQQGALLVGAAGGSASSNVAYPAAYDEVLAVSALTENDTLASFSNYGSEIELAAPGTNVLTTTTTERGSYERFSGTSFATAVVSGVGGLTHSKWGIAGAELRRHLKATAVDVGLSSDEQGCGRVDAGNAVSVDPADSGTCGDSGGQCGDRSTSGSVSDDLSGTGDSDCWYWSWEYSNPCEIVVELDGPSDADFDLYVNEGTGDCPTTSNFTHRSWSTNSQEQIVIDNPDTSHPLYILVRSYSGSGPYTLTITEEAR